MTQHTPGPWWRDDDGFVSAGQNDSYVTIADPNCTLDLDIDEREANAALIAAAPTLLAALQQIAEFGIKNPGCGFSCARMAKEAIQSLSS